MIIADIVMHQFGHTVQRCIRTRQQMFFHHADIVEGINLVRLLNPGERFVLASQFAQGDSLHGTGLVVVAVTDEGPLQFVEGILPTLIGHTDTGCLEVAGISPCLIPC